MIKACLLALLLLPARGHALTLGDLRAEARVLALDNGVRLRFSTSTIDNWLNEAQRLVALETKSIRKAADFTTTAGATYYALRSDVIQVSRVTSNYQELGEETPESLAGKVGWNWIEAKGKPTSYYLNFATRSYIAFYPWPDTGSSTTSIHYEYWSQATDLSAAGSEPWNGIDEFTPYHRILAYYAAAHMTAIDGRPDLTAFYLQMYQAGLDRMKREANDRPSYRPGIRPGTPTMRTGP